MRKYDHGGGENIRLDFSVNTNPLGMSGKIKEAVISAAADFEKYPDAYYTRLKNKIAEYEGVSPNNIAVSNGASEMIFALTRAVMPRRALIAAPAFSEYERALESVGCEVEYYSLKEENDFTAGMDFVSRAKTKDMVFICNPNNPTGKLWNKDILDELAGENIPCAIDECFLEFTDGVSMKTKLPVIKAFTKTYAMAGLRFGYLIGDSKLTEKVNRHLPSWNVSYPAVAAAMAAMEDREYLNKSKAVIKKERQYLADSLVSLGFKVYPSEVNFLLIKGREGIGERLREKGILIRECDNFIGLDRSFYRVAVKNHEENEILIKELGDICG